MPDRSPAGRFRARVVNPVVRAVLRSPAHQLLSGSVLLLEYTGRHSGHRYALPVRYAAAGDDLVVMAGQPVTKTWWRNFGPEPQRVEVTARGSQRTCAARRPDVGTDGHERAVRAYRRKFAKSAPDPEAPALVLTPGVPPSSRP